MAVVMFMVDALQYFSGKTKDETKAIAMEIAMQGTQGYSPDKANYRINSIKDKTSAVMGNRTVWNFLYFVSIKN